tara:strand:- start:80 stop:2221 length:2142 start_codon:yes stop_codon:yes gene_type:complete
MTVTNPKFFGQSTTGTPNQIEDSVDFPHTGLLKALSTASSGRYALSGFNITPAGTTGITVAAGEILYNGKVTTVNGASLTLSASHTNGYHLLVAPRPTNEDGNGATPLTSTVVLRNPTAANKVAEYTLGDTIIAVITHTGSDPHIQYLTYDKTSQAFSIAHDNSIDGTGTTYTEMGTIEATATGIVIQQDSATNLGNIQIKNNDQDRDIIFTMDDGGVEKSITLNADIATAQFADFSITTNGSVTAGGVTLSGGGTVSNHGNNRVITSGAANTDLNAEANLTFDGATLAVTGDITGTTVTTTGLITTSANNISAPAGSVTGVSIGAGTNGLSNLGKYTQSQQLAADAAGGYGITTHGHVEILQAITPANLIDCSKEHYYVGLDTQAQATHSSQGNPISPAGISATTQFGLLTKANEANRNGSAVQGAGAYQYSVDEVFGGHTFFVGIQRPESHIGGTVSITNITAFYLYVVVGNESAGDPSLYAERRRMNGGLWKSVHSLTGFNHVGNTRCVNMSNILLGGLAQTSTFYDISTSFSGDLDAILVKPRETITLSSLEITGEGGGTHGHDVFQEQGLAHSSGQNNGQWFLKGVSGGSGFAHVVNITDAFLHIPVAMTGTTFICTGTNQILLPNSPPIGTQYSFLVKAGTTSLDRPDITTGIPPANFDLCPSAVQSGGQDEFHELSSSASSAPLSIAAGNGKTVIYTSSQNWEVIG